MGETSGREALGGRDRVAERDRHATLPTRDSAARI
jgi:hypothetical protein